MLRIYRRHHQPGFGATMNPTVQPKYDFRFDSMAALAKEHRELRSTPGTGRDEGRRR